MLDPLDAIQLGSRKRTRRVVYGSTKPWSMDERSHHGTIRFSTTANMVDQVNGEKVEE